MPTRSASNDPAVSTGRAVRQRDRIIAAAIELMAEGGEDRVTAVAVAKRAEIARGTVYYHFADRPALIAAMRAGLQEQLLHLADGSHHFRNPFGLALRLAVDDESIIRSRIHAMLDQGPERDQRTINLLVRLRQMAEAGELRDGVDPTGAALICAALDFAGLMAIALGRGQAERRQLTARLSETWEQMFLHGALRPA